MSYRGRSHGDRCPGRATRQEPPKCTREVPSRVWETSSPVEHHRDWCVPVPVETAVDEKRLAVRHHGVGVSRRRGCGADRRTEQAARRTVQDTLSLPWAATAINERSCAR